MIRESELLFNVPSLGAVRHPTKPIILMSFSLTTFDVVERLPKLKPAAATGASINIA